MVAKARIFFQRRSFGLVLIALALILSILAIVQTQRSSLKSIEVVYAQPLVSLNPFTYSDYNNSRLNYIYESLVTFSEDLKISPKLAVSFGQISESHYRFRIKQDIFFHNGTPLTSEYLKEFFGKLADIQSQASLVANIQEFQVLSPQAFDIKLQTPDPLFLSKLASVPIAYLDTDLIANPTGTGPFVLKAQSENQIYLEPFSQYHSQSPQFNQLLLTTIPNQTQRLEYSLNNPNVLAIFGMSPVLQSQAEEFDFSLQNYIEGSTNFFLYNYNRRLSNNPNFRAALSQAMHLDMNFNQFAEGMAKDTNQLLASGVFGYNPQIKSLPPQEVLADNYQPQILLPENFQKLAETLSTALNLHGIQPEFTFANAFNLTSQEISSQFDLIFFGFKSDFYDGQSLFTTFLTTDSFNYGSYKNQLATDLYNTLAAASKPKQRQKILQELSASLVDPLNPLAQPLFENQVYYALKNTYDLQPRLDGYLDLTLIQF